MRARTSRDVAIIGMACVFPQASNLSNYWQNIVSKVDAIGDPPPDRMITPFFDQHADSNDRIYCKRGGYIGDMAEFNPLEYGVMPRSVEGAEPEHFMALRVAGEALADAGFEEKHFDRERFNVILGRGSFANRGYVTLLQHGIVIDQTIQLLRQLHPEYSDAELASIKRGLKENLPPFNAETAPGLASSVMTGIIANRMDLRGRNYSVDAACASGLIALENGIQDLLAHRCDAALIGAVQISTPAVIHMVFTQLGALSRQPHLRPFDADTDGTMLGEGIGMMVLKRLEDAERDQHRIYAVVKGVGSSSDGRAKGLLAPRVEGQELAMQRAYQWSNVTPQSVGLVEAHGTGLPLGDATEIESMSRVFGQRRGDYPDCAVGSVKSMIGHLIPAAGIAGLIKTALALYHKTLPPTLHCDKPNPSLERQISCLYINTETRPWIHGKPDHPRRAGVSAFGFGGINAHAVLEEHQDDEASRQALNKHWETELLLLAAENRTSLIEQCTALRNHLSKVNQERMCDLAYSLWRGQAGKPIRLAIVATTPEELKNKLTTAIKRLQEPECSQIKDRQGMFFFEQPLAHEGGVAFMFPGEGSQYLDMLNDLCQYFPTVRSCFDLLDSAYANHPLGHLPSAYIFPPPLADQAVAEEKIWSMNGAVDAVITADRALFRLLRELGITPDAIVGHSSGELMALEAAGAVVIDSDDELVKLIRSGSHMIDRLHAADSVPEAQLLAVGGVDRSAIDETIAASNGELVLAMENCPHQFVLCGSESVALLAKQSLARKGALCQPLNFNRAYHTERFKPALGPLREYFNNVKVAPAHTPTYSCVTTERFPDDPKEIRDLTVVQWASMVRFRETIENMYRDGIRLFVEVGPRANLTGFTNDILNGKQALAMATNSHRRAAITGLQHALGMLYAHGVAMELDPMFTPRGARELDLERSPAEGKKSGRLNLKLNLTLPQLTLSESDLAAVTKTPASNTAEAPPADTSTTDATATWLPVQTVTIQPTPLAFSGESSAMPDGMEEYLNTMDTFLDVQKQVMQRFMARDAQAATADAPSLPDPMKPLVGKIQPLSPDRHTVTRTLNLARDTFLQHHTLGGAISKQDPGLLALPIVPLSMALEMMAEAAALLLPDKCLVAMRNIKMHRWIAVETGSITVETQVSLVAGTQQQTRVQLAVKPTDASMPAAVAVEGVLIFADDHPPAVTAHPAAVGTELPVTISSRQLYPKALFHGPAFQALAGIEQVGSDGIQVNLRTPSPHHLFHDCPQPKLSAEPVLVDAAGQAVGLWAATCFERDLVVFPVAIDEIQLFGETLAEGSTLNGRLNSRLVGTDQLHIHSDMELVRADEKCHIRLRGLQHRRIRMPNLFHDFRGSRDVRLTSPWPEAMAGIADSSRMECRRTDLIPASFWESDGGFWRTGLAYLILSRSERSAWQRLSEAGVRRTEWLLGRLAAKEAVRDLLQNQQGIDLWLADIEIVDDRNGKLAATGKWRDRHMPMPRLSISHSDGMAVAIAAPGNDGSNWSLDTDIPKSPTFSSAKKGLDPHS